MKRLIAVSVVVLLVPMLPSVSARAADGLPVATKNVLQRWSQSHVVGRSAMTRERALHVSRHYDVVTGTKNMFTDYVSDMRAVNPNLILLTYMNGTFDTSTKGDKYPRSWYARSASGERIRSVNWGHYLMDVSNGAWADEAARICAEYLRISRYDGCYVDALGTAPLGTSNTFTTDVPIDPRTGRPWTKDAYLRATSTIASRIRSINAGRPVVANGLGTGKDYFDSSAPTRRLLLAADAGHAEVWLRTGRSGVNEFKSVADWKNSVDMLVDAGERGKPVMTLTKLWVNATRAEVEKWHKYTLASFLLGTDGSSFYTFTAARDVADAIDDHPWDRAPVGMPLGPYGATTGGAYIRSFTTGKAVVNPGTGKVTVALGGSYVDLNGVVRSSVTLGSHEGEVLVKR